MWKVKTNTGSILMLPPISQQLFFQLFPRSGKEGLHFSCISVHTVVSSKKQQPTHIFSGGDLGVRHFDTRDLTQLYWI